MPLDYTVLKFTIQSVAYLEFGKGGGHDERAEREFITGVCGQGPETEPLVGGQRGEVLLKLKHFLLLNV